MKKSFKKFLRAIFLLSGTIVGAGFFGLPYVSFKVGIIFTLLYFFTLTCFVIFIHLIFGELSLKTPDLKRLPGFVSLYLGKNFGKISFLSAIFGLLGTNLAYLVLGGKFLANLFPYFSRDFWTTIYWLFGSAFIFFGISLISKIEFLDLSFFFLILVFCLIFGFSQLDLKKFPLFPENKSLFLPYGPLLFSLWGLALIPEAEELLRERKDLLKKAIFVSILICSLFYLSFVFLVGFVCGKSVSQDAISGLAKILGNEMGKILFSFGIVVTFTSFVSLGLTLKKVFWYDLKLPKNLSFFLASFLPYFLYLCGIKQYLKIISFIGGVMLALDGILILLMYRKLKRSNFVFLLIFLLILGIVYQIIYFGK